MSHLICPLCGKNAPLSTFNPENTPLDLKTVSFVGKGRGKGFAVGETVSILGDDKITPVVAKRIEELYIFFLENGQLLFPKIITNDEYYLNIINELNTKNALCISEIMSLKDSTAKLEEYEIERQVDYIIREGIGLAGDSSQLVAGENGWHLSLSPKPGNIEAYLCLLIMDLPNDLKKRLLSRIDGDQNSRLYKIIKTLPRTQSIPERLLNANNQNTFTFVDYSGKSVERIIKPQFYPEYADKAVSFDQLKLIVKNVKEKLKDPSELARTFFENLYPKKIKLPYKSQNDTSGAR